MEDYIAVLRLLLWSTTIIIFTVGWFIGTFWLDDDEPIRWQRVAVSAVAWVVIAPLSFFLLFKILPVRWVW